MPPSFAAYGAVNRGAGNAAAAREACTGCLSCGHCPTCCSNQFIRKLSLTVALSSRSMRYSHCAPEWWLYRQVTPRLATANSGDVADCNHEQAAQLSIGQAAVFVKPSHSNYIGGPEARRLTAHGLAGVDLADDQLAKRFLELGAGETTSGAPGE